MAAWAQELAPGARVAVAVSGGGDSMALLHLLHEAGLAAVVYTVEHGLRPEAADEARIVAATAARLGLPHRTLPWRWDGRGNLAQAAREGRYHALALACLADGVAHCALAHTRGDNVESLMLGLLRGAGLDGLCGMRPGFTRLGVRFHRPLLEVSRAALRDELRRRAVAWVEDPSNTDPASQRARLRQAMATLGLPETQLARSVAHLARARRSAGRQLLAQLAGHWSAPGPDLCLDPCALAALEPELRRRTLSAALRHVAGCGHAPRAAKLAHLVARDWLRAPQPVTLHGCLLRLQRRSAGGLPRSAPCLRISREPSAVQAPLEVQDTTAHVWDRRWRLEGPVDSGVIIRALGTDGLARLARPEETARPPPASASGLAIGQLQPALPRRSLLTAPSVWRAGKPVFCPFTPEPGPEATLWSCHDLSPGFATLIRGE